MSPVSRLDTEERSKSKLYIPPMSSRCSHLKQAETKIVSFGEPEGPKMIKKKEPLRGLEGKVKVEEEAPEALLIEEEGGLSEDLLKEENPLENLFEEENNEEGLTDLTMIEDIGLLHKVFEAKLLEQQKVVERAAEQLQQSLESKLETLMNLLPKVQERIEHPGRSISRMMRSQRPSSTPSRSPSRSPPRLYTTTSTRSSEPPVPTFGNQEVLK